MGTHDTTVHIKAYLRTLTRRLAQMCHAERVAASRGDIPMSVPQLARAAGVSVSVVRTWAKWRDRPLRGTTTASGSVMYTWAQLRTFCETHPELPAARRVLSGLAGASSPGPPPLGRRAATDPEQVRAALGNLRAAADYTINAVLSAARHAEQTAIAHREQLESLAATIRSFDDLLTQLAPPTTPHD